MKAFVIFPASSFRFLSLSSFAFNSSGDNVGCWFSSPAPASLPKADFFKISCNNLFISFFGSPALSSELPCPVRASIPGIAFPNACFIASAIIAFISPAGGGGEFGAPLPAAAVCALPATFKGGGGGICIPGGGVTPGGNCIPGGGGGNWLGGTLSGVPHDPESGKTSFLVNSRILIPSINRGDGCPSNATCVCISASSCCRFNNAILSFNNASSCSVAWSRPSPNPTVSYALFGKTKPYVTNKSGFVIIP